VVFVCVRGVEPMPRGIGDGRERPERCAASRTHREARTRMAHSAEWEHEGEPLSPNQTKITARCRGFCLREGANRCVCGKISL